MPDSDHFLPWQTTFCAFVSSHCFASFATPHSQNESEIAPIGCGGLNPSLREGSGSIH